MDPRRTSIVIGLALATVASAAQAAGDADAGRTLTNNWCAPCHGYSDGTKAPIAASDRVPTFKVIANDKERNDDRLRGFLAAPHPPMPNMTLSRNEIEDIVAYIKSLRGK